MERDLEALLAFPAVPYDASDKHVSRVSSLSLVRYRTNDYSCLRSGEVKLKRIAAFLYLAVGLAAGGWLRRSACGACRSSGPESGAGA